MEPTGTFSPSIIISLFTSLFESADIPDTPYVPPLPSYHADSLTTYLNDIKCSPEQLTTIDQKLTSAWKNLIYLQQTKTQDPLNPHSGLGRLLKNLEPQALEFESRKRDQISKYINQSIDPFDRDILHQALQLVNTLREIGKLYLSNRLIEGSYLGLVETCDYSHCVKFSFDRMMHHRTNFAALHVVYQNQPVSFLTEEQKENLHIALDQQLKQQASWHYRWSLSERMASIDYQLCCHLTHYENLRSLLSQNVHQNTPLPASVSLILKRTTQLHMLSTELKASFYNLMLHLKPTNSSDQTLQEYLTRGIHWIYRSLYPAPFHETRPFFEVLKEASHLVHEGYEDLFPWESSPLSQEEGVKKYMTAIAEDNFIAAKWISLHNASSTFNWLTEASVFEDYQRTTQLLVQIQHQLNEIIFDLTQTHAFHLPLIWNERKTTEAKEKQISRILNLIQELWTLREFIDSLRLELRLGFFKQFKTSMNNQTDIYERFFASCKNKALRLFLSGRLLESTPFYHEVQRKLPHFFGKYRAVLQESRSLLKQDNMPPQTILKLFQSHKHNLVDLHSRENFPIFYDQKIYVAHAQFYLKNSLLVKSLDYNLMRLRQLFPDSSYWSREHRIIRQFTMCFDAREFLRDILIHLTNFPFDPLQKRTIENLFQKLKEHSSFYLNETLVKYIVSEKNRQDDIQTRLPSAERLLTSTKRKIDRYQKEGQFIDQTPEFPTLYPALIEATKEIIEDINRLTASLCMRHPRYIVHTECKYVLPNMPIHIPDCWSNPSKEK